MIPKCAYLGGLGGSGWIATVPEFDVFGLLFETMVVLPVVITRFGLEKHCRVSAVEARVLGKVPGKVCEVLHVDLERRRDDSMAVVIVDPRTCCWPVSEPAGDVFRKISSVTHLVYGCLRR